ncbi:COQ9 family protein [Pseudooceanicola aestuarii]|uniref:COQ9 family protein n=1 Tax=Pseudooceanicola aestuarii TaxID=2697319 RepID=UPI0013D4F680|nr:COQ9 family protein [Pseudooceanicola aestuarii]
MSESHTPDPAQALLDAALSHVPFDGWSSATLSAAARDADVSPALARALYPRGAVDLALAYHRRGDAEMVRRLTAADLSELRFRDRIAHAVRLRLDGADRELVRRGATLFALPPHAADGARAVWGTVDAIWTALGDTSDDINWYSKRATLSGVYSATVLYWLGDETPDAEATWAFLDRRIDNVMQFEKVKARVTSGPMGRVLAGPLSVLERVRKPGGRRGFPGSVGG